MIGLEPAMSVSKAVNLMKSYTTCHIWELHPYSCGNNSGKNGHFRLMGILPAVWAMVQKIRFVNTWRIRDRW